MPVCGGDADGAPMVRGAVSRQLWTVAAGQLPVYPEHPGRRDAAVNDFPQSAASAGGDVFLYHADGLSVGLRLSHQQHPAADAMVQLPDSPALLSDNNQGQFSQRGRNGGAVAATWGA